MTAVAEAGATARASRRARWLAPAAAVLGLVLALWSALGGRLGPSEDGVAAIVGERTITEEDFARALSALEADKRNPLSDADRAFALERLIEEELLVSRGLELGLAREDPTTRKALAQAMIDFAALRAASQTPSEAALRAFHAERPRLFASAPQLQVRAALVANAPEAVATFKAELAQGFEAAARAAAPAPVPPVWLSAQDVAAFLGPTVAQAAVAAEASEVVGPIAQGPYAVFVWVKARREGEAPPFETVRAAVETEWRRAAEEEALTAYLEDLKRRTRIVRMTANP